MSFIFTKKGFPTPKEKPSYTYPLPINYIGLAKFEFMKSLARKTFSTRMFKNKIIFYRIVIAIIIFSVFIIILTLSQHFLNSLSFCIFYF